MGTWYSLGVWLGFGTGIGVVLAGILRVYAPIVAVPVAGAAGWLVEDWKHALLAGAGALLGGLAAAQLVEGALRRGGTRGGTALLVGVAGLAIGALSLVPAFGYLLALVVAVAALRARRAQPERYAGLRTLAK